MGLYLSEKHGVNPSLDQCFYCMKDKGLVLFGRLKPPQAKALREAGLLHDNSENDPEAPRRVCMDYVPCSECADLMEKGIILVSVDDKDTDPKNPRRTGGWVLMREEFIRRSITPPEVAEDVLKKRFAFVPDSAWDMLGLPRGEQASAGAPP